MNQVGFYPKDSLTFAREPQRIKPEANVWTMRFHEIDGLSVTESDHESAWAEWDAAVEASK